MTHPTAPPDTFLSVGWEGTLYDCAFNQMLEMPTNHGAPRTLAALLDAGRIVPRRFATDRHCFGCTAGAGPSCAGAVAEQGGHRSGSR